MKLILKPYKSHYIYLSHQTLHIYLSHRTLCILALTTFTKILALLGALVIFVHFTESLVWFQGQMWYYTELMMHFSHVFKHGYFAIYRNNMTHPTVTTLSDTCILCTHIRPTRTTSKLIFVTQIKIIQMHDTKNITMDKINLKQTQNANTFAAFCSP